VEEIVKEAKRSKANLIVMGSHGRSALSAIVLKVVFPTVLSTMIQVFPYSLCEVDCNIFFRQLVFDLCDLFC